MVIPQQHNEIHNAFSNIFNNIKEEKILLEIKGMTMEELKVYKKSIEITIKKLQNEKKRLNSEQRPILIKQHLKDLDELIYELEQCRL